MLIEINFATTFTKDLRKKHFTVSIIITLKTL